MYEKGQRPPKNIKNLTNPADNMSKEIKIPSVSIFL